MLEVGFSWNVAGAASIAPCLEKQGRAAASGGELGRQVLAALWCMARLYSGPF